jgi:hypothetical protein
MTPVEELFQLLWDTPKDKLTWFTIRKQMMEKEKQVMIEVFEAGMYCNDENPSSGIAEEYYYARFKNEKF